MTNVVKKKYFLVYVDQLGFEELAQKEAKNSTSSPEELRSLYQTKVERVLSALLKEHRLEKWASEPPDSWLLFVRDKRGAFRAVEEILKTRLEFEIAVGVGDFEESLTANELMELTDETVSFLKKNILSPYKKWYKDSYPTRIEKTFIVPTEEYRTLFLQYIENVSIKKTFIVATEDLYNGLGFKKTICRKIVQAGKTFYKVNLDGLTRRLGVWKFSDKIDLYGNLYQTIDELYVKPKNYEEIYGILNKNGIVFLIGDPGMGKTYTAIKLLFDLYKQGWEPIFYQMGWLKTNPKIMIELIEELTQGKKAIYIEDPFDFGIDKDNLSGAINVLVFFAKYRYCKIIITSRQEVFKKFKEYGDLTETLVGSIVKFQVGLTYGKDDLKDMIDNYLDVFKPEWFTDKKLKEIISLSIENEQLTTPMNIALLSQTSKVNTPEKLVKEIENISVGTTEMFAKTIQKMFDDKEYDKITFLSFAYINVNLDVAKKCYNLNLSSSPDSQIDCKEFGDVHKWFKEEVKTIQYPNESTKYLIFSHPTYAEAFSTSLKYKNVVVIFGKVLTTILNSTDDKDITFRVLKTLDRDPIKADKFFDIINILLCKDSYEINNLALKTLLKKREHSVDKTFEILKRTIDESKKNKVVNTAFSLLPRLKPDKTEEIFDIYTNTVENGRTEFFRAICFALRDIDIRIKKTTAILQQISDYDYGKTLFQPGKDAYDLLIEWGVIKEATDINLEKLRNMNSNQAVGYIRNLMFGSEEEFNRCNLSIHFFGFVIEETYKSDPENSFSLMKELIERSSDRVRPSWIVARSLFSNDGLEYNNVKNLVESDKYILRFSGFLAIFQLYTWLDHFCRKYDITEDSFNKLYNRVKKQSIELLTILNGDEDEFLSAAAAMLSEEIQDPSIDITLSITEKIRKNLMLSQIGVWALKTLKSHPSMDKPQAEDWGSVLFALPLTRLNPERAYPVFEVFQFNTRDIIKIAKAIAYEFRKNPENIFEMAKKLGRNSEDYFIRNIFIDITPFFGATIPNETLDELESLLSDSKYDDIDSKIVLTSSLHVMKQMFGLIVNFVPDTNPEPKNIIERIDRLLSQLMEDPSHEVGILAEIARDGIQFKN